MKYLLSNLNNRSFILLFVTIYEVIFNIISLYSRFENYFKKRDFLDAFLLSTFEILLIFSILLLINSIFIFHKKIYKIWLYFTVTTTIITTHYIGTLGIAIDSVVLENIFLTDKQEVFELFDLTLLLKLIFFVIFPTILIARIKINSVNILNILKIYSIILLFIALFIALPYRLLIPSSKDVGFKNISFSISPLNIIIATVEYFKIRNAKPDEIFDISKNYQFYRDSNNIDVVLVIGETARSDHFGFNGYEVQTTPNLSKNKNLISFKSGYSCATSTARAMPCILTRFDNKNKLPFAENSIASIFKKIGFKTSLYSMHHRTTFTYVNNIINDYSEIKFASQIKNNNLSLDKTMYDEELLPFAKDSIGKNSNFITLKTLGSHPRFSMRYPSHFNKFTPVCNGFYNIKNCDIKNLINEYDNTILYTDHFLSELIKIFEKRNAIIIYASDHGTSLGENGNFLHSFPMNLAPKEQIHIGFFFWASNEFKRNNIKLIKNIEKNKNKNIGQDSIFHSLLDCVGIKSKIIDKNLSFCSNNFGKKIAIPNKKSIEKPFKYL